MSSINSMTGIRFFQHFFRIFRLRFSSPHGTAGAAALVVGTTFVAPSSSHLRVTQLQGMVENFHQASGRNTWNFSTYGEISSFFERQVPNISKKHVCENHNLWKKNINMTFGKKLNLFSTGKKIQGPIGHKHFRWKLWGAPVSGATFSQMETLGAKRWWFARLSNERRSKHPVTGDHT